MSHHQPAAKVPLLAQIEEVEREIRQRVRVYPKWVKDGRYKQETADAKLAAMRAVQSTLIWLETFRDDIHDLHRRLKADAASDASDASGASAAATRDADFLAHPAVTAVMDAFPEARIAAVRDLEAAP